VLEVLDPGVSSKEKKEMLKAALVAAATRAQVIFENINHFHFNFLKILSFCFNSLSLYLFFLVCRK